MGNRLIRAFAAVAAFVPPFPIGSVPLTLVVSTTAPKLGAPAALPCRTVVAVPSEPSTASAWLPAPITSSLAVSDAAEVVQVAHPIVPVVVIVPPVIGLEAGD